RRGRRSRSSRGLHTRTPRTAELLRRREEDPGRGGRRAPGAARQRDARPPARPPGGPQRTPEAERAPALSHGPSERRTRFRFRKQ
ncbi:hypothetical protein P7K49_007193, partial [Saguinus oedipus]